MLLDNLSYINSAISNMKSCFYESIPTTIWRSIDLPYSVMNNIEATEYHKAVAERLSSVHTRVIRGAVPAVRKGPGNESTARRMPQSKMHLKFNMGRDNRLARKQLQLKSQRTSDKIIRKLIDMKGSATAQA
jgi:hypothetical protein